MDVGSDAPMLSCNFANSSFLFVVSIKPQPPAAKKRKLNNEREREREREKFIDNQIDD
jgi:hypothetical protein